MSDIIEFIFGQYSSYSAAFIWMEVIAIIAGVISVLYSKKNHVLVYPYGILSTIIFLYLLYQWEFIGDFIIFIYYLIMSVYGWYIWSRKVDDIDVTPITQVLKKEWIIAAMVFISSMIVVYVIYIKFEKLQHWYNYVDILTTGIAFVGMWLMAQRKLEHWLVLLVANVISVPLYFYKMYEEYQVFSLTAVLYIFYTVIAWMGYLEWKRYSSKQDILEKE